MIALAGIFLAALFIPQWTVVGAAQTNDECFACHTDADLAKEGPGGKRISLYVDEKTYQSSIHSRLQCVLCHSDILEIPHKEGLLAVQCGNCHAEEATQYLDSIHSRSIRRGDLFAPACKDCHGKHNVLSHKDPQSRTARGKVLNVCGACHEGIRNQYAASYHGQLVAQGDPKAPTCYDCHSSHEIALLTLPAGEWRRRMRLGAQELARNSRTVTGEFDLVVVADMLDLPTFLALTRPRFGRTPVLAYFHENQFTYPRLRGTKFNSWFGEINYLSALVADHVAFNSEFHRHDFLAALRTLAEQPNNWLDPGAIAAIEAKSSVLPVGVELTWLDGQRPAERPEAAPLILWSARWEFDKAPDVFARAVTALAQEGLAFRVAVAGEPGPNPHPALVELPLTLGKRLVHFGFVESAAEYARLLWESDIVVSTARHEFFGVAMVEALYGGCAPCAPNRFNYPDLVPAEMHDLCLWESEDDLVAKLRALITGPRPAGALLRASAERFSWSRIIGGWDKAIASMSEG